jgi:hypothetical protein
MTRFLVSLFTRRRLRRSHLYHYMFLFVTLLGASSVLRRTLRSVVIDYEIHDNLIPLVEPFHIFGRGKRQDSPDLCL